MFGQTCSECGQFIFTHCVVSLTLQTLCDRQHVWPNLFESTSYLSVDPRTRGTGGSLFWSGRRMIDQNLTVAQNEQGGFPGGLTTSIASIFPGGTILRSQTPFCIRVDTYRQFSHDLATQRCHSFSRFKRLTLTTPIYCPVKVSYLCQFHRRWFCQGEAGVPCAHRGQSRHQDHGEENPRGECKSTDASS